MPFAARHLSVLAYANGFTLWHYKLGRDPLEAASSANFFGAGADMLTPGDMVMLSGSDGGKIVVVTHADIDGVSVGPLH
jgi:hypothetical protein